MNTLTRVKKCFTTVLIGVLLMTGVQAPATAGVINNQQLAMEAELQLQRDEVRSFVARDDVRATLQDYGVDGADLDKRIDNMTESELLQIQNQLDQIPAGGDGGVLGVILVVILLFVLLDVLGATDVFPNV
jgi:hypothetical protein